MRVVPITDEREAEQIKSLKTGLVDEPAHLNLRWLAQSRWLAVPVESAGHFDDEAARLLADAFQEMRCSDVFAVATEDLGDFPDFLVEASKQGLLDFSWKCAHFNYALLPRDRTAAVLCTVYDYFLVAGPYRFVSRAVGGDVEAARAIFDDVASDPCWDGRLQKISERYRRIAPLMS